MRGLRKTILIAIVAAFALAMASSGVAEKDPSNPPGSDVPQVQAIEPAAEDALSVLGRERSGIDRLPGDMEARLDRHADFGMNPRLSRVSIGNAINSVYLIPARDHVCAGLTVGEGMAIMCPSTEDIAAGKAAPSTVGLTTRDIGIYGVVPDGVEEVTIHAGAPSEARPVPVQANAYFTVVQAGTPLHTVRYMGPEGRLVEFEIIDPSRAFEGQGISRDN
jgi:hypothetical protein